jgi:hypothetical protein
MSEKKCEICGKSYEFSLRTFYGPNGERSCVHDEPSVDRKSKLRKENRDRSIEASLAAAKLAQINPQNIVNISRPKGFGASKFGNQSETVPVSVIESLKERAIPRE